MIRRSVDRYPAVLALLLLLAGAGAARGDEVPGPGHVDCSGLKRAAGGEDAERVEVNLSGALMKIIARGLPEEMGDLGGLESIHALILEAADRAARQRVRDEMRAMEKAVLARGWTRLALVKEEGEEVRVLVLNDDENILGLLVLVVGEDEIVCANVAGVLDLEAIERLGEEMDIPGLDDLEEYQE
jgi:hypothetical protein